MDVAPVAQSGPALDISAIVGIISAIAAALSAGFAFWPLWIQRRTQRLLEAEFGSELYMPEVLDRSTRYYIRPKGSSVDPGTESEMRNVVTAEQDLFELLDKFLSKDSSDRHLILLADSGMGKSSCLLNYYVRNQRKAPRKRHRVAIVPLGNAKADEYIASVPEKQRTCLFLDAFDEDTKAITDHRARLGTLMSLCEAFRRVVITCRTQFFAKDEEIPQETGIVRFEPRKAGETGTYRFKKVYLSPFDDEMVDIFLRKRYPIWRYSERRQARKVVRSIPLLSVRPMLLAFMPDLIASGESIRTSFELYDCLVASWLDRESRWVS
ncbi:MAG TPA: hypothetical protein VMW27_22640, partial [Thermoanaerobaculia bacterium]|nr:hypothetical protein [Thermoanaerobaculia bacterium]